MSVSASPESLSRFPVLFRFAFLFATVVAPFACRAVLSDPALASPPNVVVIFADDLGWADLGVLGAEGFATPRLDRMANEGILFTDFYVPAPVCTPSRAALLTGCHPVRLGLGHRVLFPYSTTGLHHDEITLAELLAPAGYVSACIGKWHLGHQAEFLPRRHGFDRFFGVPYSNDMDRHDYRHLDFRAPPLPLYSDEEVIERAPAQALLTKRYTEEAIRFLREHHDRPFFLYLAHTMPHQPIAASEEFVGRSELGLYGDVIEEIDWSTGEILDALAELGLEENTLVVFSSDNGPWRRESAGALRGKKNTTWEGGMRVPGVVRWPGRVPAGERCGEVVSVMDLLPTVAGFAGVELPDDRILDGRDIAPLLCGETGAKSPHDEFLYYRDERLQAVRSGRWKLHVHRPEWKGETRAPLLFDLEVDRGESSDVAAERPEVVQRLLLLAEAARADLGDAATGRPATNARPVGTALEESGDSPPGR